MLADDEARRIIALAESLAVDVLNMKESDEIPRLKARRLLDMTRDSRALIEGS